MNIEMTFSLKKILSVIVSNEAGVLTRVATVFSSRGFNIETMTIGSTQNPELSKIIIVLPDETVSVDQVMKQLNKLVQVLDVQDLSQFSCIERELMLIKLSSSISNRSRILEIVEIFKKLENKEKFLCN
jgi:acetolactate synthase-1/3 small subunit